MKIYGLIGYPLGHSWSPRYFNDKFKQEGISAQYQLFPIEDVSVVRKLFIDNPQLNGLNVTIPHKESVIPYLDQLSETAKAIGAVNTIQRKGDSLIGHNTDVAGFEKTLHSIKNESITGAIILGCGGAAKAVKYVLSKKKIPFLIVSRSKPETLRYSDITPVTINKYNLVINTTPVGMYPNNAERPPFPIDLFSSETTLIDLIYNPEQTLLMQEAARRGAKITNGLTMLIEQANTAWALWQA